MGNLMPKSRFKQKKYLPHLYPGGRAVAGAVQSFILIACRSFRHGGASVHRIYWR